jgi:hypothetical protein
MRAAQLVRFFRVQSGVNAAEDDVRTPVTSHAAHFIAAKCVAGVNPDPDQVAGLNALRVDHLERFVDDDRISKGARRRCGKYVKPAWRDHADAVREMAGID